TIAVAPASRNARADGHTLPLGSRALRRAPCAVDELTHGTVRSEFPRCARCALKTLDRSGIATGWPEYMAQLGRVPSRQGTWPRQPEGLMTRECDRQR